MHKCQKGLTQAGAITAEPRDNRTAGAVPGNTNSQAGMGTLVSFKDKYTKSWAKQANDGEEMALLFCWLRGCGFVCHVLESGPPGGGEC